MIQNESEGASASARLEAKSVRFASVVAELQGWLEAVGWLADARALEAGRRLEKRRSWDRRRVSQTECRWFRKGVNKQLGQFLGWDKDRASDGWLG